MYFVRFYPCPVAIAYSMGQIIKPVCVSQCVYPSVGTLTKIDADVRTPKSKNEFAWVNIAQLLPLFCPKSPHFRSRGPENPCKH